MEKNIINTLISDSQNRSSKYLIILIANVAGKSAINMDFKENSIIGDYYTIKQFQEISDAIIFNGFELLCYYNENDFIKDYLNNRIFTQKEILVINTAKTGTNVGRKSLIPSFCDLNKIKYLGCDPYIISFAKDKFHWHLLLQHFKIPVCDFWLYQKKQGWSNNFRPSQKERVIAKLNNESCSMGLSSANVCEYSPNFDNFLLMLSQTYNQNIIIEKFISGFEVETPIIISTKEIIALEPIAITIDNSHEIGDHILDYDTRVEGKFSFQPLKIFNQNMAEQLKVCAKKAASLLDLSGISRIDFRINRKGDFYITDIATTPFITKHSSLKVSFENCGLSYEDFICLLIGLILDKYNI